MAATGGPGPWGIDTGGMPDDRIKMDYAQVTAGVEAGQKALSDMAAGLADLHQALALLHEVDRGQAASVFQERSHLQVQQVEEAQSQLHQGLQYLSNKVDEFGEAEAQGAAAFGG